MAIPRGVLIAFCLFATACTATPRSVTLNETGSGRASTPMLAVSFSLQPRLPLHVDRISPQADDGMTVTYLGFTKRCAGACGAFTLDDRTAPPLFKNLQGRTPFTTGPRDTVWIVFLITTTDTGRQRIAAGACLALTSVRIKAGGLNVDAHGPDGPVYVLTPDGDGRCEGGRFVASTPVPRTKP